MGQEAESKTSIDFDYNQLSAAERKAVLLMRELKPYQMLRIQLDEKSSQISIIKSETLREDFPVDM